jgi:2'-5' RNA ligase
METIRVFIAVDIGDEIRRRLDELQRKLKKVHSNVRWVNARNIHLTLVFLGDLPIEQITPIKAVLNQACQGIEAFELQAAGTGTFGGRPNHPHVVWAGIDNCPPLAQLQHDIAEGLAQAEIDFDQKPFSPHLTLGRVKGIDRHTGSLLEKIKKYQDTPIGNIGIDHVELIQSDLTPRGAEYTVLHRVALNKIP